MNSDDQWSQLVINYPRLRQFIGHNDITGHNVLEAVYRDCLRLITELDRLVNDNDQYGDDEFEKINAKLALIQSKLDDRLMNQDQRIEKLIILIAELENKLNQQVKELEQIIDDRLRMELNNQFSHVLWLNPELNQRVSDLKFGTLSQKIISAIYRNNNDKIVSIKSSFKDLESCVHAKIDTDNRDIYDLKAQVFRLENNVYLNNLIWCFIISMIIIYWLSNYMYFLIIKKNL